MDNIDNVTRVVSSYRAPFEKYWDSGLFMKDSKLQYRNAKSSENTLEKLERLSENHWISLNMRKLQNAKNIALEMKNIFKSGEYNKFSISDKNASDKLLELKFRCCEQIEMSLRNSPDFDIMSDIRDNINESSLEFACMYDIAMNITNTPLYFEYITYNMINSDMIMNRGTRSIFQRILGPRMKLYDEIVSTLKNKYKTKVEFIENVLNIKKKSYMRYLNSLENVMKNTPYDLYRTCDRGQTSGGHYNTCMFNSVFYADQNEENISSTKCGSLSSGISYVNYLDSLFTKYNAYSNNKSLFALQNIRNVMNNNMNNSGSDAVYSFAGEVENNMIIPGILSTCSAVETQCHSLCLNLAIFPKNVVRRVGGSCNSIFSYYGSGYFGSENFAISTVSCSLYHAQSFIRR